LIDVAHNAFLNNFAPCCAASGAILAIQKKQTF
jgi:hypothetical protein